jgi:hypothetical protein
LNRLAAGRAETLLQKLTLTDPRDAALTGSMQRIFHPVWRDDDSSGQVQPLFRSLFISPGRAPTRISPGVLPC